MKKIISLFSLIAAILVLPIIVYAIPSNSYIKIISSDEDGVIIELNTPSPKFNEVKQKNTLFHKIIIPGFRNSKEVGSPQLPEHGTLIGVPEKSKPGLDILETDFSVKVGYNIYPTPKPFINSTHKRELDFKFAINNEVYNIDAFMPFNIANITFSGFMRHQKVVRITFCPFRFNPTTKELIVYSRILVKINFNIEYANLEKFVARKKPLKFKNSIKEPFEKLLKGSVLNYDMENINMRRKKKW